MCHDSAFIRVTYVPKITHGKQIGNRKQTYWKKKRKEKKKQGTLSKTNY